MTVRWSLCLLFLAGVISCQKKDSNPSSPPTPTPAESPPSSNPNPTPTAQAEAPPGLDPELVKKGATFYKVHCLQCHNKDPRVSGSLGPDIAFSSLELLEARVLRLEYPPGYKPKRASKQMLKQPHLAPKLPAIHAYLNSFPKP